jgi:hypothetical protein
MNRKELAWPVPSREVDRKNVVVAKSVAAMPR